MNHSSFGRSLRGVALVTGLLLLIPLVAMQFTGEVMWGPGDFLVAAVLLFAAGTAMAAAVKRFDSIAARMVAIALVALVLAAVWAELAVGLFD